MSLIEELLSSKTRAAIFGLLFGVKEEYLHIREMERRSGGKGLFIMPRGQDWATIREKCGR